MLLAVARFEADRVLEDQRPQLGDLTSWPAWGRWRDTVVARTMTALDFELPAELRARLEEASAVSPSSVYRMFTPGCQGWLVSPGVKVGDKPTGYVPAVRNWVAESVG
ncbi:hypothetical protein [Streptosporangium sp. NPDC000509]|uniref:hypothetical protein n=1 Tax=Streptosporangium sp. NPDC000509 TaxID=3366186 RepID=UPI003680AC3E